MMLKRSTPSNIVIGGAAGALPPVIGWAAVTGNVALPALLLFLIVFYWTPPHFWALALRIRGDYAAAGVPMLPVVRGIAETSRQIGLYTILLVALTVVFAVVARMGLIYAVAAAVLGALFLWRAWVLWRQGTAPEASTAQAIRLYRYSITYLTVLFAAVALDTAGPRLGNRAHDSPTVPRAMTTARAIRRRSSRRRSRCAAHPRRLDRRGPRRLRRRRPPTEEAVDDGRHRLRRHRDRRRTEQRTLRPTSRSRRSGAGRSSRRASSGPRRPGGQRRHRPSIDRSRSARGTSSSRTSTGDAARWPTTAAPTPVSWSPRP